MKSSMESMTSSMKSSEQSLIAFSNVILKFIIFPLLNFFVVIQTLIAK